MTRSLGLQSDVFCRVAGESTRPHVLLYLKVNRYCLYVARKALWSMRRAAGPLPSRSIALRTSSRLEDIADAEAPARHLREWKSCSRLIIDVKHAAWTNGCAAHALEINWWRLKVWTTLTAAEAWHFQLKAIAETVHDNRTSTSCCMPASGQPSSAATRGTIYPI